MEQSFQVTLKGELPSLGKCLESLLAHCQGLGANRIHRILKLRIFHKLYKNVVVEELTKRLSRVGSTTSIFGSENIRPRMNTVRLRTRLSS